MPIVDPLDKFICFFLRRNQAVIMHINDQANKGITTPWFQPFNMHKPKEITLHCQLVQITKSPKLRYHHSTWMKMYISHKNYWPLKKTWTKIILYGVRHTHKLIIMILIYSLGFKIWRWFVHFNNWFVHLKSLYHENYTLDICVLIYTLH